MKYCPGVYSRKSPDKLGVQGRGVQTWSDKTSGICLALESPQVKVIH